MDKHLVEARESCIEAHKRPLAKQKEFTRLRDELSRRRRELPWVRVDKPYAFDGPDGRETSRQLFAGRSQLIVYHFMFDPKSETGCKSYSFWADNFDQIVLYLDQRDVSLVAISASRSRPRISRRERPCTITRSERPR